jgi:formylglycine-generating enzyme required for sulfatase activity
MNRPIIAAACALLVVGGAAAVWLSFFRDEAPTSAATDEPPPPGPIPPSAVPPAKLPALPAAPAPRSAEPPPLPTNPTAGASYAMRIGKTRVELPLRWIPPGAFAMGSTDGRDDEKPVRKVIITRGFWMGQTEVTQAQWKAVLDAEDTPSQWKEDARPVENVTWDEARQFCAKLSQVSGRQFRLPREAEWEYACRAKATTPYSHGDGEWALQRAGWYDANAEAQTHPVGKLAPNPWGLSDVHGNVWEWCEDWYSDYPPGNATDPVGPATGTQRVIRGGSWFNSDAFCRTTARFRHDPAGRRPYIGFRVLWVPEGK